MDGCHPPANAYAICELPCGLNCNLDFSHGYHYTETNLGGHCFSHEPLCERGLTYCLGT